MKAKVLFTRFQGGNAEHPDTTDWLVETVLKAKSDPRIGEVLHWRISDTPITMGRNRAARDALAIGADFQVMIDSDMTPDLPGQQKFWDVAWPFMVDQEERALKHGINFAGPCMIAAPYCGPPPHENVYIFHWTAKQSDHPNPDFMLSQFGREEAAIRAGIEEVAALPTGLAILDLRAYRYLKHPYFYYEWADDTESEKASTEDVTFTRDLSMAGIPCYVAWDCWAGHNKSKCVHKPGLLYVDDMKAKFQDAIRKGLRSNMRLVAREREAHGGNSARNSGQPGGRVHGSCDPAPVTQGCDQGVPRGVAGGAPVQCGQSETRP